MAAPWSRHESHNHCGCCGRCSTKGHYVTDRDFCSDCKNHLTPARVNGEFIPQWDRTYFAQHKKPCPFSEDD